MQILQKSNHKYSSRYKLWLIQAAHDLDAARLSQQSGFFEWSTYQSIQSAEKALKSVIIRAGFRPPKTHGIGILIGIANSVDRSFKNVKFDYRKIEAYTFISRYPFVSPQIDMTPHEQIRSEDAKECIEVAESILTNIEDYLRVRIDDNENIDSSFQNTFFTRKQINQRIEISIEKILSSSQFETQKIVLFGSFARSRKLPLTKSMDILIIAETALGFFDRIYIIKEILKGDQPPIIEPIVYTPAELKVMLEDEGEGFLESALEEGKVIWEAKK